MADLPVPQRSLGQYLIEINKLPLLTPKEEFDLATHYRETGDVEAAHKLVTANLRFVVKIAHEYNQYGMRISDLIQEGNIGLMIAVKKFDPQKGYRLISYAVWWIRAMIQSFILKSWSLVKIGTTQAQRKLFYKLRQTKQALSRFIGGENHEELESPEVSAIAKKLNVREEDVLEMDGRLRARDASLDQPLSDDNQTTSLDLLTSTHHNQEEVLIEKEQSNHLQSEVAKVMTGLNDKERYIVEKRLMTDDPMTLQAIGDRYHISRERARQLEERAKNKIRLALIHSPLIHSPLVQGTL